MKVQFQEEYQTPNIDLINREDLKENLLKGLEFSINVKLSLSVIEGIAIFYPYEIKEIKGDIVTTFKYKQIVDINSNNGTWIIVKTESLRGTINDV